jgi:hypothetical protein
MRDRMVLLLVLALPALAQWQPDQRLTVDSAYSRLSYNNTWGVAAAGDTVHVVWYDNRDGNYEVYYKRSTDAGATWDGDTRLTNDSAASAWTSLAVSGGAVHVAWMEARDGNVEIYYKRSTNGGFSWGSDIRLTNDTSNSFGPCVAASDSQVHVTWYDSRDGNAEIYYKRSTNGGFSWGSDTRLTNDGHTGVFPSVAVAGSAVRVVWLDDRDGTYQVYHKYSTDGGFSWGSDTRLTSATANAMTPSVAVSGDVVNVVWPEWELLSSSCRQSGEAAPALAAAPQLPDSNPQIYYISSTDGGATWGMATRLTSVAHESESPSIAVAGNVIHLTWVDQRDGNREVYYKRSTDGGFSWGNDTRLTSNGGDSDHPSVATAGNAVHVVWSDDRDGNYELYYKRDPTGGAGAMEDLRSRARSRRLAATIVRSLPQGAVAYDAMGRRVLYPKPGVYFVTDQQAQAQALRKVLLVR